jgi:hypothetical protein
MRKRPRKMSQQVTLTSIVGSGHIGNVMINRYTTTKEFREKVAALLNRPLKHLIAAGVRLPVDDSPVFPRVQNSEFFVQVVFGEPAGGAGVAAAAVIELDREEQRDIRYRLVIDSTLNLPGEGVDIKSSDFMKSIERQIRRDFEKSYIHMVTVPNGAGYEDIYNDGNRFSMPKVQRGRPVSVVLAQRPDAAAAAASYGGRKKGKSKSKSKSIRRKQPRRRTRSRSQRR